MSLTWRSEWVSEFETPWSIFEKVKSANILNTKQLLSIYGTEDSKRIKVGKVGKRHRDLMTMVGLDQRQIFQSLNLDLKSHVENNIRMISNKLPINIGVKEWFQNKLYYCPLCMELGYHSFLHQVTIFKKCPFHDCNLLSVCRNCEATIPYELPEHSYESGFICSCGNNFSSNNAFRRDSEHWNFSKEFIVPEIQQFINLPNEKSDKLGNAYSFRTGFLNKNNALNHTLDIANSRDNTIFTNIKKSLIAKQSKESLEQRYADMYKTLTLVVKSFEKQLCKTILKNHKHCIQRFVGLIKKRGEPFPSICPFAFAYVFWKESFLNLNPFYNEGKTNQGNGLSEYKVPFFEHAEAVESLMRSIQDDRKITFHGMKWAISHLTWRLARDSYRMWLINARDYAAQGIRITTKYDEHMWPNHLFSIVKDETNSKLSLHFEDPTELTGCDTFVCPYKEKRYKKISDDEISFLPLRLTLTPGFENEKREAERYLAKLKIISIVR